MLGITIYAIGIGKAIEEELREIASDPPDKHLFYAEEFSAMEEISNKLQKSICEGIKHRFHSRYKISRSTFDADRTSEPNKNNLTIWSEHLQNHRAPCQL